MVKSFPFYPFVSYLFGYHVELRYGSPTGREVLPNFSYDVPQISNVKSDE